MANVGNATLIITPKFDGLSDSVNKALGGVDTSKGVSQMGTNISGGLMANGAVIGAVSTVVGRAMDTVSSHMGSAISRLDTLKNYPQVMESLGVSTEEADASIQTMSDRLSNLPTRLDDMASTVQGIYAASEKYGISLTTATDAGLALNSMLLAGGGSAQVVNAAMEQFRQMLSKGKPDMQDWRSLLSAAPGQMNQLAKAVLGADASIDDLYAALGGGGAEATISMGELLQHLVDIGPQFETAAEEAQGGIGTAMANMGNSITRGITDVLDAIGRENIVGVMNDIKGGIRNAFSDIADIAQDAAPMVKDAMGIIGDAIGELGGLGGLAGIFGGLKVAEGLPKIASGIKDSVGAIAGIGPAGVAIGGVAAVIGTLYAAFKQAKDYEDDFTSSTKGLSDAVRDALLLDDFNGTVSNFGDTAKNSALSVRDLVDSVANHAAIIQDNNESAQEQIAQLTTAQDIISEYAGKTDLSAEAQGRLEWALAQVNDQFGLTLTAADVANDAYTDTDGNVQNLTDSLNTLIDTKKREIQMDVLKEDLTEAYQAESEAAKTLAAEQGKLAEAQSKYNEARAQLEAGEKVTANNTMLSDAEYVQILKNNMDQATESVDKATEVFDAAEGAYNALAAELGDTARQVEQGADALDNWANSLDMVSVASIGGGANLAMLKDDIRALGISTDELERLTKDDLDSMLRSYDGTIPSLMAWIDQYNANNVDNKEAHISVSDYELVDANGEVVVWNGTQLVYKSTEAKVNQGELKDSLGNVYTWNGTQLKTLNGSVVVDTSSVDSARAKIANLKAEAQGQLATGSITTYNNTVRTTTYIEKYERAAGGIRTHADGGIRYHAGGSIVNAPVKGYPLDLVGEDGAEAIVPLTNRKYSQPFIDLLAEGVTEKSQPTTVNNYSIGSLSVPEGSALAKAMENVFAEAKRYQRMGEVR